METHNGTESITLCRQLCQAALVKSNPYTSSGSLNDPPRALASIERQLQSVLKMLAVGVQVEEEKGASANGVSSKNRSDSVLQMLARFKDHVSSASAPGGGGRKGEHHRFLTIQEVLRHATPVLSWHGDLV